MAKGKYISWLPGYSIQMWGKFYGPYPFGYAYPAHYSIKGYAVYRRQPTGHGIICIKEKYYYPYNPRTPKQQAWRQIFADGVSIWQDLTAADKENYNGYSYPLQMSGYNKFLHYYLKEHI